MIKQLGGPGGFCSAWSLYYLDARLSNPDIPPDILLTYLLNDIREGAVKTPEGKKNNFTDFIRNYSNYVLSMGMKIIENFKLSRPLKEIISSSSALGESSTHFLTPSYLYEFMLKKFEEHKNYPIKVITGFASNIRELIRHIRDLNIREQIKNTTLIPLVIKEADDYKSIVNKIKHEIEEIHNPYVVFIGESIWLKKDENYGRDVFEGIDAEKFFLEDKEIFYSSFLEDVLDLAEDEIFDLDPLSDKLFELFGELKRNDKERLTKWARKIFDQLKYTRLIKSRTDFFRNLYEEVERIWELGYNNPKEFADALFLQEKLPDKLLNKLGYKIETNYGKIREMVDELS